MAAKARPGALPAQLSPAPRRADPRRRHRPKAATAKTLGLGAQEKLVVRDVVKDADGTTPHPLRAHLRRTARPRRRPGRRHRQGRRDRGASPRPPQARHQGRRPPPPTVARRQAEKQALTAAKAAGAKKADADRAPAQGRSGPASGTPTLAYETVVGGLQDDGTPNELHVITDATTGEKLYEYQGIETGTGNTQYSGTVTLGTTQSGLDVQR